MAQFCGNYRRRRRQSATPQARRAAPVGAPVDAAARPLKQLPAMLAELEWFAVALRKQRDSCGPPPPA